jgi:hypothetical protein
VSRPPVPPRSAPQVFAIDGRAAGDGFDAHAELTNRRLLWHGTNVAVVAAILKSGLRIMPHSGGRVGSGIYLASENGKSAGYVGTHGHVGIMFLCEAALGKQRLVNVDGQVCAGRPGGASLLARRLVVFVSRGAPRGRRLDAARRRVWWMCFPLLWMCFLLLPLAACG